MAIFASRPLLDLLPDRDTVGPVAEVDDGEQQQLFELAEAVVPHYYFIEALIDGEINEAPGSVRRRWTGRRRVHGTSTPPRGRARPAAGA